MSLQLKLNRGLNVLCSEYSEKAIIQQQFINRLEIVDSKNSIA